MPENAISRSKALQFISEISRAISQNDNPEELLDRILSACIQITAADSGSIMLLDPEKETLQIRASRGLDPRTRDFRLKVGEGITGWVARHGRSRLIEDASKEEDYVRVREGLSSELAVPLNAREELIGVLSVDAVRPRAFVPEHREVLEIMADLAALIFANLRDNLRLKMRDRFHRVLIEISHILSRSLELEAVFREIMIVTEKAFRLFRSTLLLYNSNEDKLKIAATTQAESDHVRNVVYNPGEGITGGVFLNKEAVFIPDIAAEPGFLNRMRLQPEQAEGVGFFCCPIFSGSEVVGVFSTLTRHQEGIPPDSLMEFLTILGSMISQAITIQKLVQEEKRVIESENIQLRRQLGSRYEFGNIIGRSTVMLKLFEQIRLVADSRASVLITGESGTGKELIASALHYNSPRRERPFVKINCAAIPENLLESELFGHRKGSFTGAVADKKGKFESADGGTIFLDEIGELDLNLQSKLLRVLQEREIEPIGGRTKRVDIRIIAATNADLEEKISRREFRSDLYYRLNVINLLLPPLRERREDILLLVHRFVDKYAEENGKSITGVSARALQVLEAYDWPGNVRELENTIERAVVLAAGPVLDVRDLQTGMLTGVARLPVEDSEDSRSVQREFTRPAALAVESIPMDGWDEMDGKVYDYVISEVEKKLIAAALKKFRYTKTRAARYLGINRNTLDKKIKELRIDY